MFRSFTNIDDGFAPNGVYVGVFLTGQTDLIY